MNLTGWADRITYEIVKDSKRAEELSTIFLSEGYANFFEWLIGVTSKGWWESLMHGLLTLVTTAGSGFVTDKRLRKELLEIGSHEAFAFIKNVIENRQEIGGTFAQFVQGVQRGELDMALDSMVKTDIFRAIGASAASPFTQSTGQIVVETPISVERVERGLRIK